MKFKGACLIGDGISSNTIHDSVVFCDLKVGVAAKLGGGNKDDLRKEPWNQ